MKEFINKPANISRIEFWASTTIYVFAVFFLITSVVKDDGLNMWTYNRHWIEQARITFNYYEHYFYPQLVRYTFFYLNFLLFNFSIIPGLIEKRAIVQNVILGIVAFVMLWGVLGTTDTYLKAYVFPNYKADQGAYNFLFQSSLAYTAWLSLMLGFYTGIKYAGHYLLTHSENLQSKYRIVTQEGISAFVLWMISVFLLLISRASTEVITTWITICPSAIALYWYSFYSLIPASLERKRPFVIYLCKVLLVVLIATLPIAFVLFLFVRESHIFPITILFNMAVQLLITAPFAWTMFKRRLRGKEEVRYLKTALGRSNAKLDFLRSQINPHFLFNALNTIYGTALQEKAERTSEGIEKLGDMMRFMLQENMQDRISLTREVDYMNNYISLQRLRTDPSPEVTIQAEIEEQINGLEISPMLLIPFVENAFKHGISLREPSHIKITLQTRENILYFDVHNSIHLKADHDPEKNKSGIGLDNIKQRLHLIYPGKHELIIRETGKEYFVHLTIHLN